ncbi:MAG: STAS domain-containing protein [Methylococcaceae bacterium]|nr:STAS domain-containing protein [Methylococcaceae bacterium]
MSIQVKEQNGMTHIVIKDEMTIYTALEQKNELSQHLKADHELEIELSEVSEIDSAGLQILLFLKQEASTKNIILTLTHHSQSVIEVLELLNLTAHFGDPIILSADRKSS